MVTEYPISSMFTSMLKEYRDITIGILDQIHNLRRRMRSMACIEIISGPGKALISRITPFTVVLDNTKLSLITCYLTDVVFYMKDICYDELGLPEDICSIDVKPEYTRHVLSWREEYVDKIKRYIDDMPVSIGSYTTIGVTDIDVFNNGTTTIALGDGKIGVSTTEVFDTYVSIIVYPESTYLSIIGEKDSSKPRRALIKIVNDMANAHAYIAGYIKATNKLLEALEKNIDKPRVYDVVRRYII